MRRRQRETGANDEPPHGRRQSSAAPELRPGDRPAGPDDAHELRSVARRVGHVAEEIGERDRVELAVAKGIDSALASTRSTRLSTRRRASVSISGLWSTPTTRQPCCRTSSSATAPVPVATSRTRLSASASTCETRNRRQRGSWPNESIERTVVGLGEWGEQRLRHARSDSLRRGVVGDRGGNRLRQRPATEVELALGFPGSQNHHGPLR